MGSDLKKTAVWQNNYMCSCPHLSLVIKVRFKYAKDTLFIIKIVCPCFISFSLYWFIFVICYCWSYAFTFFVFKYVISLHIVQCAVSYSWNAMQPSRRSSKDGMLSSLVIHGQRQRCNTKRMEFSVPPGAAWFCRSTTSSTSVKPKVISPPRAYRALHSSYSFGNWVEKMGDYQNRGRGLWVSGHVDIPLSWVSVTLTGRALACPLLWFNPQTTARPCVSPHSN